MIRLLRRMREFALLQIIQTVPVAHPAFFFNEYRVKRPGVRLTAHIHLASTLRLLHVCAPLQMIVSVAMSPCPVVRCPDSILLSRHVTLLGGLRWDSHRGSTNTWNFGTLVRMVSAVLW